MTERRGVGPGALLLAYRGGFFHGKKEACLEEQGYTDSGQGSEDVEGPLWGSWAESAEGASMISSAWT